MKFWLRNRLKNPLHIYNHSCFSFNPPIHNNLLAYKPLPDGDSNDKPTIRKTNTIHNFFCLGLLIGRAK